MLHAVLSAHSLAIGGMQHLLGSYSRRTLFPSDVCVHEIVNLHEAALASYFDGPAGALALVMSDLSLLELLVQHQALPLARHSQTGASGHRGQAATHQCGGAGR